MYETQGRDGNVEKWERGREMIARDLQLVKGAREGTRFYLVGKTRDR